MTLTTRHTARYIGSSRTESNRCFGRFFGLCVHHGHEVCCAAGGKPALVVAVSQAAEDTTAAATRIVFVEDRLAPLRGLRDVARPRR